MPKNLSNTQNNQLTSNEIIESINSFFSIATQFATDILKIAGAITSFAKMSGKTEDEVEELWKKAKFMVDTDYKDIEKGSDQYFMLATGILKKTLKINNRNIL